MIKINKISGIIILVVILMIVESTLMAVTYITGTLTAATSFASADELFRLRGNIPGLLVPATYAGLPSILIMVSILMFFAGYYYGKEMEARSSGHSGHSNSETTTTTSTQGRSILSGRFTPGVHVEQTRTQTSSNDTEQVKKE